MSYGEAGGFDLRSGEIPAARPCEFAVQTRNEMKGAQYNENAVSGFLSVLEQPIGAANERGDSAHSELRQRKSEHDRKRWASRACFAVSLRAAALAHRELDGRQAIIASERPKCTVAVFGADGVLWVRTDLSNLYRCDLHAAPDPEHCPAEVSGQACTFAAQTDTRTDGD